eukprot:9466415-Pyramimonas_sp.AAC.1
MLEPSLSYVQTTCGAHICHRATSEFSGAGECRPHSSLASVRIHLTAQCAIWFSDLGVARFCHIEQASCAMAAASQVLPTVVDDAWSEPEGDESQFEGPSAPAAAYCFACLVSDRPSNLKVNYKGQQFHAKCWDGVRSHNRQVGKFPQVKATVEDEFDNDPAAWRKRVAPFIGGDPDSRRAARVAVKKDCKEVEQLLTVEADKELDDTMRLTETEFMAFEKQWHLKGYTDSKQQFQA